MPYILGLFIFHYLLYKVSLDGRINCSTEITRKIYLSDYFSYWYYVLFSKDTVNNNRYLE